MIHTQLLACQQHRMVIYFYSKNDIRRGAPHILSIHISPCPTSFRPLPFGLKSFHKPLITFGFNCCGTDGSPQNFELVNILYGCMYISLARALNIKYNYIYTHTYLGEHNRIYIYYIYIYAYVDLSMLFLASLKSARPSWFYCKPTEWLLRP